MASMTYQSQSFMFSVEVSQAKDMYDNKISYPPFAFHINNK